MSSHRRLRLSRIRSQAWNDGQPQVPGKHMRPVLGALFVEQLGLRFPVEPASVKGPIGVADEAAFRRPAAFEQRVSHLPAVEPSRALHYSWIAPRDLIVAEGRVEIISDARLEPVNIDVDQERIAAGLDPRK